MSVATDPLPRGAIAAPGYEILGHLSRGRRLDVYDAWSHERGCRCVIKAIRPERAGERRSRELLAREGRLLERLGHPHLVRGYETILDPAPMIVIETLAGRTLARLIDDDPGGLGPADVAQLGLQLGSAVRYLHRNGFLHLDLKPANVVAEAGRARLIDLSLARPPGPAPPGLGTWGYLAPEQATGGELGPAADVWGLGAVLFEAATGVPAFGDAESASGGSWTSEEGSTEPPTWASDDGGDGPYPQLEGRADRVGELRPLPSDLAALIDSCLEPPAGERPPLESLLAGLERAAGVAAEERRWPAAPGARPGVSPAGERIGVL